MEKTETPANTNFIRHIIDEDLKMGKHERIATRFPPEPNGYLHIGHAKAICLNFGIAEDYKGTCNLRFDDTNPVTEETEYVDAIQADVKWLGFNWAELKYASDYFEELHQYAIKLIQIGMAYVCSLTGDEIRKHRGTLTDPGRESPYRNRSIEENLSLFERMGKGEFADGTHVLRAKIDMNSPNLNLRDPVLYRIRKARHHRTGDRWCIYPMYDYAHALSDMIEGITHSLCTLEFEDHRPLYDWFLETLQTPKRPRQIEFSRLNLDYTVMSKRKLLELVQKKLVSGWDDPRMPTLQGLRRRGFPPEAIRDFAQRVGVTKKDGTIEIGFLEMCVREHLDRRVPRAMAVLKPLKIVIENYLEGPGEELDVPNHPNREELGNRKVPFSRTLYIECDDFMENPSPKFFRLAPGKEVRLRSAYYIRCEKVVKNASGEITELRCVYDPATRGGGSPDGRKVKGTLHWVSAQHAKCAEIRLYDRLFTVPFPGQGAADPLAHFNPKALETLTECWVEPSLVHVNPESCFQFERLGFFCADRIDYKPDHPVFNRTVTLRDSWAKINT